MSTSDTKSGGSAAASGRTVAVEKETNTPLYARKKVLIGAGVGVVAIGLVALAVAKMLPTAEPPRMNDSPKEIVRFFTSSGFTKLPFDRQVAYLKQIDDRENELVQAYRARDISDAEYRSGMQAAYLGRHLSRMEKYFERTSAKEQAAYLDRFLKKKEAEKTGTAIVKKDGTREVPSKDLKDEDDVKEIKRDDSTEAAMVASWPADIQDKWKRYHAAADERKKQWKETKGSTKSGGPAEAKNDTRGTP